jgi:dienelactone hydrolase
LRWAREVSRDGIAASWRRRRWRKRGRWRKRFRWRLLFGRARAQITGAAALPRLADGVVYTVSPSVADPDVKRFTADNIILFEHDVARKANLLVFFSGTRGTPASGAPFLEAGAKAGYRVIGLTYDNADAVPVTCGKNPDPACSDRFRERRVFGDGAGTEVDDSPAESAVNRLTKLLEYLDAHHHDEGWGIYLRHGKPDWSRIAVAGHSQGGGMAAYIAKKRKVARVIILSGAWDRVEATKVWAPWITSASATPMDRWYAAYHQRESRADAMKPAYVALKIPASHVRVMTLPPNPEFKAAPGMDVYHGSMVSARSTPRDATGAPAYAGDWAFLLGSGK